MNFDGSHTLILAILVLYTGRYVNGMVSWLRRNSIPEPVAGGAPRIDHAYARPGRRRHHADLRPHVPRPAADRVFHDGRPVRTRQHAAGLLAGSAALSGGHGTVLAFVTALCMGIVLSNVVPPLAPRLPWPAGTPSLALIAEIALGLFLAMSLMSLNLTTLADAALPLLVVLTVQVATCWFLLSLVVFRLLGRTYDAAMTTAGSFGLALGATPTAIAIMTAVTKAHGASPRSFLVVPLVGAFFVDIANAFVLQGFIQWLGGR